MILEYAHLSTLRFSHIFLKQVLVTFMNKRIIAFLFFVLLPLNLYACSNNNTKVTVSNPAIKSEKKKYRAIQKQRIVVLTPLIADLIFNLDKSKLVGIPNSKYTDIIAKSQFRDFPRVGTRAAINLEVIISLKPDLVIGVEQFHDQYLAKLEKLGFPTIAYKISSWQDLQNMTKDLAEHIGANPRKILDKYQSYLDNIPINGKSVLVLLRAEPTSSPNKNSWTGDLLAKFKYKNLAANFQSGNRFKGYLTLSPEKIIEANPDKLFIIQSDNLNPDDFKKQPFWNQLKAVKNNQVYVFHHDGLITPTSLDTVEEVTNKLREVAGK
jgi:iron complex transport system substrate-binding protein